MIGFGRRIRTGESTGESACESTGESTGESTRESTFESTFESTCESACESTCESAAESAGESTGDRSVETRDSRRKHGEILRFSTIKEYYTKSEGLGFLIQNLESTSVLNSGV